jgi:signal transduction histidine kinase
MSLADDADQLARELFETKSRLRGAGRVLHDQVGPLLSAAGIRLGLLRSDHPEAAEEAGQALLALEEAMERVRSVSRELNPPPGAHLGLKKALFNLAEGQAQFFSGEVRFSYTSSVEIPEPAAASIYEIACTLLERAAEDPAATRLSIEAAGARRLVVKVASNGRLRASHGLLAALSRRANPAGIVLDCITKRGTIVSIRYAARRPSRG